MAPVPTVPADAPAPTGRLADARGQAAQERRDVVVVAAQRVEVVEQPAAAARDAAGAAWCWGANPWGQQGTGSTDSTGVINRFGTPEYSARNEGHVLVVDSRSGNRFVLTLNVAKASGNSLSRLSP